MYSLFELNFLNLEIPLENEILDELLSSDEKLDEISSDDCEMILSECEKEKPNIDENLVKDKDKKTLYDRRWFDKLHKLELFIKKHNKRPKKNKNDVEERVLANWFSVQLAKQNKMLLSSDKLLLWVNAIKNIYTENKKDVDDIWTIRFKNFKKFTLYNGSKPYIFSPCGLEKSLALWGLEQDKTIAEEYINKWKKFKSDILFSLLNIKEAWYYNFTNLKNFMLWNKRIPSRFSKDNEELLLARWISLQNNYFNNIEYTMSYNLIYDLWKNFKINIPENINDGWFYDFDNLNNFIILNLRKPKKSGSLHEKNLAKWLRQQVKHYVELSGVMKSENFRTIWKNFIDENDKIFPLNIKDSMDIVRFSNWKYQLKELTDFLDTNKNNPNRSNEGLEKKLSSWLSCQNITYRKKTKIMKNKHIYDVWSGIKKKYKTRLMDNREIWYHKLKLLEDFYAKYKRGPNKRETNLYFWYSHQRLSYRNKINMMKFPEILEKWELFLKNISMK